MKTPSHLDNGLMSLLQPHVCTSGRIGWILLSLALSMEVRTHSRRKPADSVVISTLPDSGHKIHKTTSQGLSWTKCGVSLGAEETGEMNTPWGHYPCLQTETARNGVEGAGEVVVPSVCPTTPPTGPLLTGVLGPTHRVVPGGERPR